MNYMAKRISIKRIEPIVLDFADGTTKEVIINNDALIYLTSEFGDIANLLDTEIERPYELASKILYAGMKVADMSTTLEEAKAIMIGGGTELMTEMFIALSENFGEIDQEELKKNLIPMVNKYLKKQK